MPELDVVIVGAGPSGLAVAHRLQAAGREVKVLEAADAVGGRMRTLRRDGFRIDTGAEMIATHGYPATWRLIRELGITDDEVPIVADAVSMWRDGRVHRHVGRPKGMLTGAGLTMRGRLDSLRLNVALAPKAKKFDPDYPEDTPLGQMTVAELGAKYGDDLNDYVLTPLVGGLFGWDPARSSAALLIIHLLTTKDTAELRSYSDGMDTLARRLADGLDVDFGCTVQSVSSGGDGVRLETSKGTMTASSVVLCVPAPVALALHATAHDDERPYLEACTYAPMLRLTAMLDRPLSFASAPATYGVLVPPPEDPVLAVIGVGHNKVPGRAPEGCGMVALLPQPHVTRELLGATDDAVVERLMPHGDKLLPGLREATTATVVHRFANGLPEATPAALGERAAFMRRPVRAVEYSGDWLVLRPASEGAFRAAELTAARVLAFANAKRRAAPATPAAQATRAS